MEKEWGKIRTWLESYAPDELKLLNKGAKEKEIKKLESAIGHRLPDDYRTFLQIHNGCPMHSTRFLLYYSLLSTHDILAKRRKLHEFIEEWKELKPRVRGPIVKVWLHKDWLPIAITSGGDLLMLDLAPPLRSKRGQIIEFWLDGTRNLLAPTFLKLIEKTGKSLEEGKIKFFDKKLGISTFRGKNAAKLNTRLLAKKNAK